MQTPSNANIQLNYTPSDSVINSLQIQISTLQQQIQNQQIQNQTQLQTNQLTQNQIQQQLSQSQMNFKEYQQKTDEDLDIAKKTINSQVWNGLPNMKISDMCTKVNPKFKYNTKVPVVQQINKLNISDVCNSLSAGSPIANIQQIKQTNTLISTDPIESDNIVPFCNPNAISSTNYQTEACVCNQFSALPILHEGTVTKNLGNKNISLSGYYCSAN